jgi:uncharacterized protein YndB with AHSA1/START domain
MNSSLLSVQRSIVVDVEQTRAFNAFVAMTDWWPLATHTIGEAPARASIVEPRTGGRWYGIDKNGAEHGIGYVLAYEPPDRLLLSWEISCGWEYDPNVKPRLTFASLRKHRRGRAFLSNIEASKRTANARKR